MTEASKKRAETYRVVKAIAKHIGMTDQQLNRFVGVIDILNVDIVPASISESMPQKGTHGPQAVEGVKSFDPNKVQRMSFKDDDGEDMELVSATDYDALLRMWEEEKKHSRVVVLLREWANSLESTCWGGDNPEHDKELAKHSANAIRMCAERIENGPL